MGRIVKGRKNLIIIDEMPAKYRLTHYDEKGEVIGTEWVQTRSRANITSMEMAGKKPNQNVTVVFQPFDSELN